MRMSRERWWSTAAPPSTHPLPFTVWFCGAGSITTSQPLTVTDDFQFLAGTLQGSPFTSQQNLTIGAPDDESGMTLRTRLINQGQATWLGRNIGFQGGVLQNDGTFLDTSDGRMVLAVFADGVVENNGTWTIADTVGDGGRGKARSRFFNQGEFQTGQSDVRIFRFEQNDGTLLLGGGTVEVHGQDLRISDGIVAETARSLPT